MDPFSLHFNCVNCCPWLRAALQHWRPCRSQPLAGAIYIVVCGNGHPRVAHGGSNFRSATVPTNSILVLHVVTWNQNSTIEGSRPHTSMEKMLGFSMEKKIHSEDLWWFLARVKLLSIPWNIIMTLGMLCAIFQDPMTWNELINHKGLWQRQTRYSQAIPLYSEQKATLYLPAFPVVRCGDLNEFWPMDRE